MGAIPSAEAGPLSLASFSAKAEAASKAGSAFKDKNCGMQKSAWAFLVRRTLFAQYSFCPVCRGRSWRGCFGGLPLSRTAAATYLLYGVFSFQRAARPIKRPLTFKAEKVRGSQPELLVFLKLHQCA
jgi:hypothetical protein